MKIQIDVNTLLEFLDKCEGGQLYPRLHKEDSIIEVNVNPITAEFVIGQIKEKEGEGNEGYGKLLEQS